MLFAVAIAWSLLQMASVVLNLPYLSILVSLAALAAIVFEHFQQKGE